jgi:hypothetical protein
MVIDGHDVNESNGFHTNSQGGFIEDAIVQRCRFHLIVNIQDFHSGCDLDDSFVRAYFEGGEMLSLQPHSIGAATIRHCNGDATARFQHFKPAPEACFHVIHMLGHVSGVNLIRAIRFETRQDRNILVTIGPHLAVPVDVDVTFLVENPTTEIKLHLAKISRARYRAIGLAARTSLEIRNLCV